MNLMLIGCGNIGKALLNLWGPLNLFKRIMVIQPSMSAAHYFNKYPGIDFVDRIDALDQDFSPDLIVVAVKPNLIEEVMPVCRQYSQNAIIISLLAGVKLELLASFFQKSIKIVRIMPNVAIKTGKSVNLMCSTKNLESEDVYKIENTFGPTGSMVWIEEEHYLDTLTPISGSGPAYFFLLAETLIMETVKMGIDENMARELIREVFIGSASLAYDTKNFEALIHSVASKKGVTEAALKIMRPSLKQTIEESLKAAFLRLNELSTEN